MAATALQWLLEGKPYSYPMLMVAAQLHTSENVFFAKRPAHKKVIPPFGSGLLLDGPGNLRMGN